MWAKAAAVKSSLFVYYVMISLIMAVAVYLAYVLLNTHPYFENLSLGTTQKAVFFDYASQYIWQ
jgi:hypothetical protein